MSAPSRPPFYLEGTLVPGRPGLFLARILARHSDEVGDLPAHIRRDLEAVLTALEYAGRRWLAEASASGSVQEAPAEAPVRSNWRIGAEVRPQELSTTEAATLLKVTERRVRQLAQDLNGHRRQGRWYFDRSAVVAYRERKHT